MYQDIIQQFVFQLEKSENTSLVDPPHVLTNTMRFFRELLVASLQPRLMSTGIFSMGYFEKRVCMATPQNFKELKSNIVREIENIDQKTLKHINDVGFVKLILTDISNIYCKIHIFIYF